MIRNTYFELPSTSVVVLGLLLSIPGFAQCNAPPSASDDVHRSPGVPVLIAPLANDSDVDGDVLSITLPVSLSGSYGQVSLVGGTSYSYVPTAGYEGSFNFIYTAADSRGGESTARATSTPTTWVARG